MRVCLSAWTMHVSGTDKYCKKSTGTCLACVANCCPLRLCGCGRWHPLECLAFAYNKQDELLLLPSLQLVDHMAGKPRRRHLHGIDQQRPQYCRLVLHVAVYRQLGAKVLDWLQSKCVLGCVPGYPHLGHKNTCAMKCAYHNVVANMATWQSYASSVSLLRTQHHRPLHWTGARERQGCVVLPTSCTAFKHGRMNW